MTEISEYIPKREDLMPVKRKYIFRAGMKSFPEAGSPLAKSVNRMYAKGLNLVQPVLLHMNLNIGEMPESLIPDKFKGATTITLFVSSLGQKIDDEIEKMFEKGKASEAALLDAWASEALECLNDAFDAKLRKEHSGGGTMRFSPGYGNLSVLENKTFLEILKNDKVRAVESGALIPRKSTTCMIGWY